MKSEVQSSAPKRKFGSDRKPLYKIKKSLNELKLTNLASKINKIKSLLKGEINENESGPKYLNDNDEDIISNIPNSKSFNNKSDYVMEDDLLKQNLGKLTKVPKKQQIKLAKIKEIKSHSLPAKHPEAEKRTIFIGNVNAAVKRKKLQQFFSQYGDIESTRYRGIAAATMEMSKKEAITQQKLHPDRNTLIAYIRFKEETSKNKALAANGLKFEGFHLRVDHATPQQVKEKNAIFVGNLPFEVEDENLWNLFNGCGEIESIRVVRSSLTGAGKGFGFVNFKSQHSVEMAMQLNGELIKKRPIRIKRMAKKGKEKKIIKTMKSATSSLVKSKKQNKLKLAFMKKDKPKFKLDTKKGKKKEKINSNITEFIGAKTSEEGKLSKKKRKPRRSKEDKKKIALSKILIAKTGLTK